MNQATETTPKPFAELDKMKASVTLFVSPTYDIKVSDSATNIIAQGHLKTILAFKKQVNDTHAAAKKPHLDAGRTLDSWKNEVMEPLEKAEQFVKLQQEEWGRKERIAREAAQRKLDDERIAAERAAAAERQRIEDEAKEKQREEMAALKRQLDAEKKENERLQKERAEAQKAFGISQAKINAEKAEAKKAADDKAAADRAALQAKIDQDKAEAQARLDREERERIDAIRTRERAIEASRPKNIQLVPVWEIVDRDLIPQEYWIVNEQALGAFIKANAGKDGFKSIPGVKVTMQEKSIGR